MLYSLHGGTTDEEAARKSAKLRAPQMLQKQLADFKRDIRKLNTHTVQDDQTWFLQTSYVMRNRLARAAVANRQAVVMGLPKFCDEDAEKIMLSIMAMKAYDKKKHTEAYH